jgi:hypothetical protein
MKFGVVILAIVLVDQCHGHCIWPNFKTAHESDTLSSLQGRLAYHLVDHGEVTACNIGVISGFYKLGVAYESLGRLRHALRAYQLAMIYVYTLRQKTEIPIELENEWKVRKIDIVNGILRMRKSVSEQFPTPTTTRFPRSLGRKIAIATICAYPQNHAIILPQLTPINRKHYAERHGYTYIVATSNPFPFADVQHSKLLFIRDLLRDGYQGLHLDWVMWTDCDSIFMTYEKPVDEIIDLYSTHSQVDLLITEELLGLSSANFIVRNTQWSIEFLQEAFQIANNQLPLFGDQDAIIVVAFESAVLGISDKNDQSPESPPLQDPMNEHIVIIPQRTINSYDALNGYYMGDVGFREGDLLVTFPQCRDPQYCNGLFREAFKVAENGGTLPTERTGDQLRVFGPISHLLAKT